MLPKYKIKFSEKALHEIGESWDWYEEQQYGAGDKFKKAIEKVLDAILKSPDRYPFKQENLREIQSKQFPVVLIYRVKEKLKTINIVSAFHTKSLK
jgi:plasmid stabilization system protein ParE